MRKKAAIDWQGAVGSVENDYFCCCLTLQGFNSPHGAGWTPQRGEFSCLGPTMPSTYPQVGRRSRHNLAAHKVSGIRQAIESCGATLFYLPPYFPDLNPIEFAAQSSSTHCALLMENYRM